MALAAPGYPAYRNILKALDIEPVLLEAEAEHRFQPTPALLEAAAGRIDGLIVASPSNPTGTMLGREAFSALVAYCADRGIRLVSDEIYHGIDYGREAVSALELSDVSTKNTACDEFDAAASAGSSGVIRVAK